MTLEARYAAVRNVTPRPVYFGIGGENDIQWIVFPMVYGFLPAVYPTWRRP